MKIELINCRGFNAALFGIGLSHGLTSGKRPEDISDPVGDEMPNELRERLEKVAGRLAPMDGGHNKFLRQIVYWWDATLPRFLWQEVDQYRIGVTTQSESTMHTIMHRNLVQDDFEEPIHPTILEHVNGCINFYKIASPENKQVWFLKLKNELPEGFLQRRVWSMSLANMKNIYHQRRNHRLPQWKQICEAFVEATPDFLRGMYNG